MGQFESKLGPLPQAEKLGASSDVVPSNAASAALPAAPSLLPPSVVSTSTSSLSTSSLSTSSLSTSSLSTSSLSTSSPATSSPAIIPATPAVDLAGAEIHGSRSGLVDVAALNSEYQGKPLAPGMRIGRLFRLSDLTEQSPLTVAEDRIDREIRHVKDSVDRARESLIAMGEEGLVGKALVSKTLPILLGIKADRGLYYHINNDGYAGILAGRRYFEELDKSLVKAPEEVRQVFELVRTVLLGELKKRPASEASVEIEHGFREGILFAPQLKPLDLDTLDVKRILAFVVTTCPEFSSIAQFARDNGIPLVSEVELPPALETGAMLLVDGVTGKVKVLPEGTRLSRFADGAPSASSQLGGRPARTSAPFFRSGRRAA